MMQVINRSLKKILCIVIVAIMTVTIIYNDYEEAEATGVEEVLLIEALLSLVASMALEQSGIVADISHFVAEYVDDIEMLSEADYVNMLVQEHNSGNASDEIEQLYSDYVDYTKRFYLDIIRDMNKTGAVDEDSALAYITNLFENDYVTENEVRTAFQNYCTTSEICKSAGDAASFAVNAGCIGLTKKLVNIIGDEFSAAMDVYMDKMNNSPGDSYSKEFDHSSVEFCLNSNTGLPSEDSDFIQFILSLDCPYMVYTYSVTGSSTEPTYYVFYRTLANEIRVDYQASNNGIYGYFYDEGSSTTQKCQYSVFKSDGSLSSSSSRSCIDFYVGGSSYYAYDVLFWNKCSFYSSLLELLGVTYLPESHLYSADYAPAPSAAIPIDNLYEGVDVPSQSIDDTAADDEVIYYIDSGITDLADEVAALKVAIDNLDTDGKTYEEVVSEIDKALDNVQEKAESKVESDVKNNINNSLSLNYLDSPGLDDKFPFCIPFDLIDLISALDAEPVAPKFTIPVIKNEKYGWDYSITVDWSDFEVVAEICRGVEVFCFIGFLILKTRSLIRG